MEVRLLSRNRELGDAEAGKKDYEESICSCLSGDMRLSRKARGCASGVAAPVGSREPHLRGQHEPNGRDRLRDEPPGPGFRGHNDV